MTFANSSIPQHYTLDLEPEGRLILPQEIQEILNLESGDRLILTLEGNGKLQLVSLKQHFLTTSSLRILLVYSSYFRQLVCFFNIKILTSNIMI